MIQWERRPLDALLGKKTLLRDISMINVLNATKTARVLEGGLIAVPKEVLQAIGVTVGDYVSFIVEGATARIEKPAILAMKELQREMEGEAERLGFKSEEDAMTVIKEIRSETI